MSALNAGIPNPNGWGVVLSATAGILLRKK